MAANPKLLSNLSLHLHNGDQMKQPEFHIAYSNMPDRYRAELIGGMVFEPSPVSYVHGQSDSSLMYLLAQYATATKYVEKAQNVTLILGEDDEVQPDGLLRLPENLGGRSRIKKGFLHGSPELVAEIAYSSRAIDLHLKKQRYAKAGVTEYIVYCLEPKKLHWFRLQEDAQLTPDNNGTFCSIVFPGLWINEPALIVYDSDETDQVLREGLSSEEFQEFKKQLQCKADLRKPSRRRN